MRGADAGDDILALRVDQEFAVISALAGRRIAGEGDAGGAGLTHVAEHHRLDVDRRAPTARNVVQPAIDLRPLGLPRSEHRADRAPQLILHVLREGLVPLLLDKALVGLDQPAQIVGRKLGVEGQALVLLGDLQRFLERAVIELQHHVRIHLDEAAVAVPSEARVSARGGQPLDRRVVEPQVEHRVHHPRHRGAGARADRDEQGIALVAEFLAGDPFDMRDAVGDLVPQAFGEGAALVVIAGAHLGRDGEARRHGQADAGHAIEVGALAAQQILVALPPIRDAAAEAIDVALGRIGLELAGHIVPIHQAVTPCIRA